MDRMPRLASLAARVRATAERLAFLPPLLTRVALGVAFVLTGRGKLGSLPEVAGFFEGLGIPLPGVNAFVVAMVETVGGAFLVVGACCRPAAALLAGTMVVALGTADRAAFADSWAFASGGPLSVTPFAYLVLLSWLVVHGGGPLSFDRLLAGRSLGEPLRPAMMGGASASPR